MKKNLAIAIGMALAGTACAGEDGEYTAGTTTDMNTTQAMSFQELDTDADRRLSEEEATEAKMLDEEAFARADTNQDNYLSQTEFELAQTGSESWDTTGTMTSDASAGKSFEELDADRDSRLSEEEATDSQVITDSEAFALADLNQDDYLSRTEFDTAKSQGGTATAQSFEELDTDRDSRLSEEEATESQIITDSEAFARADTDQNDYLSQTEWDTVKGQGSWSAGGTATAKSFEELDTDRDSKLSEEEVTESAVLDTEAFARADTNQDDHLSQSEYDVAKSQISTGSSMAMNFEDLDVNRDSLISEQEATDSQILDSEAFARADTNQDGYLSQTEFQARGSERDPAAGEIEIETETEIDDAG